VNDALAQLIEKYEVEASAAKKSAEAKVATLKLPLPPDEAAMLGYYERELLTDHETEWEPYTDPAPIISERTEQCPRCKDRGEWRPFVKRGVTTGILKPGDRVPCDCAFRKAFWHYVEQTLPPRYRYYTLNNLNVSPKSRLNVAAQERLYSLLREKPDDGYAIFGPVGTSKTTVSTALYRYQLQKELRRMWECDFYGYGYYGFLLPEPKQIPVWRIDAKTLLLQHHDFAINRPITNAEGEEIGGAREPDITRRRIEKFSREGRKSHIFLEEIDKVELTKARRDTLFDIWNAGYEYEAQMVINTNLTKDEFQNMYGAEFVRRIIASCTVIDLFSEEWK
jgi:DNA replication protein DnaC